MHNFDPKEFEAKWQKKWREAGVNRADMEEVRNKYYLLVELPYPSGDLHMGHWFTFAVSDILGRYMRAQGSNVFMPIGFDAFGLPAENAAIKKGIHPKKWTYSNIEKMKGQFATMGTLADFEHGVITSDPLYYRWNQWIFLKMFEKGLAYKGRSLSNWCPSCQTVLANENVEDGHCWRCGTEVVQKEVAQWFLKITDYAEKLLWSDAGPVSSFPPASARSGSKSNGGQKDDVELRAVGNPSRTATHISGRSQIDWPKPLRDAQNHWIGRSEGVEIRFSVLGSRFSDESRSVDLSVGSKTDEQKTEKPKSVNGQQKTDNLVVFTKFPETIFGVTYMVLAPEHSLVEEITTSKYKKEIHAYMEQARRKPELERTSLDKEKTGVFTGSYCINPVDGRRVPIWVADYVIASYGTGAVMGVPGSDIRDYEFAKKYGLEVIRVIGSAPGDQSPVATDKQVLEKGWLVNSGQFDGLAVPAPAKEKITGYLETQGFGKRKVNYHLHDWSISRQRYWGTPIPIIYCPKCMERDQLSVLSSRLSDSGQSVSQSIGHNTDKLKTDKPKSENRKQKTDNWIEGVDFLEIEGKKYKIVPVPYGDLPVELPYDVDWAPKGKPPLATDDAWVKVKCPVCKSTDARREVETMDTFVDSSWYFLRYLDPENEKEIFDSKIVNSWFPAEIYVGGAEHTLGHTLYSRFFVKFLYDLGLVSFDEYAKRRIHHGIILGQDGSKMSKSRGNVVNPDEEVAKYGADAVRTYLAFLGPYEIVAPWNPGGIRGIHNFYQRVWRLVTQNSKLKTQNSKPDRESERMMHKTIKKVGEDIEKIKFNTAVAALMEWLNFLEKKLVGSDESVADSQETKKLRTTNYELLTRAELETFLLLLAPFGPHIAEELWQMVQLSVVGNRLSDKSQSVDRLISHRTEKLKTDKQMSENGQQKTDNWSIHQQSWPKFNEAALEQNKVTIAVQVNGKVRDQIEVKAGLDEAEAKKLALGSAKVTKYIGNKEVKKLIYIRDKIISLVI